MKAVWLTLCSISLSACGSWKKDTLAYTAGSALLCGTINAAMAPEGEKKAMHFALGGSVCGLAVGTYRVYTRKEDEEIAKKERQINILKMKLGAFKDEVEVSSGSNSFMEAEIPEDLRKLVKKQGQWQLFKMDKWEKTKKGYFIHHDKAAKLIPPKFIK
jgi:hypothetical protein